MLFTETIAAQGEGKRKKMEQEKHQNQHTKYEKNIEKGRRSTDIKHNFP